MLTHGLLPPEKLEKVRSQLGMAPRPAAAPAREDEDQDDHEDDDDAGADRPPAPSAAGLEARVARLEVALAAALARLDALDGGSGG
jgi:hypothetical protein